MSTRMHDVGTRRCQVAVLNLVFGMLVGLATVFAAEFAREDLVVAILTLFGCLGVISWRIHLIFKYCG
jgi:uncharacterized membrane protein